MTSVGIVGGGAAGLIAAVFAAKNKAKVTVFESGKTPGKKLSQTGNGRGNYTNISLSEKAYPYCDAGFLGSAFSCFDQYDAILFFMELGIIPRLRNGYVYPRSEQAQSLTEALINAAESLGVTILTQSRVNDIGFFKDTFKIYTDNTTLSFDKIILAAGGKTAPKTGSDGSGFILAKRLGIRLVSPAFGLCGITIPKTHPLCKAEGVRVQAGVSLMEGDRLLAKEEGEVQIGKGAVSGIPVMHISLLASRIMKDGELWLSFDFLPEFNDKLARCIVSNHEGLYGSFPKKLAEVLLKTPELSLEKLRDYRVLATGLKEPDKAQITCGGADTYFIDPFTMESKDIPGLYLAGEIIDVDGICGGYNLQWAWTSGALAGCAAANSSYEHKQPDDRLLAIIRQAELSDRRR